LETKFRKIFVFWRSFWIQNGHHSKPKWSQYSAAYLTPCKYPFPLKSFHFWIFNDFKKNYLGSHFEIFKNKEHNFEWWSIFVSSFKRIRCLEWILHFFTLVTMATSSILNFFNPSKAATHYGWYSYKVSWKKSQTNLNPPFLLPWQLRQNLSNRFRCFGLSRSTRCGCCSYQDSSISVCRVTCYDHFCVFHFFSILAVSMAMAAILKKSTIKGTTSHGIWYSYKVS
jgi:hypothetical protein